MEAERRKQIRIVQIVIRAPSCIRTGYSVVFAKVEIDTITHSATSVRSRGACRIALPSLGLDNQTGRWLPEEGDKTPSNLSLGRSDSISPQI
ncbi:hypothetical protein CMEL01_15361 [Colletotrichum melonis]|uniref:Uncharacterized protein n=1 Tax=Colletotrichum melonis TaxID=1209925 RepID=A0AAI9UGJ1_9PEZI|nr:hypothetical protein CMEL01_15361 [Colletotrichum melonis]